MSARGVVTTKGLAVALLAVAACGPTSDGPIGVSNVRAPGADVRLGPADAGHRLPPAVPPTFRATFKKVNASRFVSRGHYLERYVADVYVNEAGFSAYEAGAEDAPVGTILIEELFERSGAAGPLLMMEKRPPGFDPERGDWRYVVVGAGGALLLDGKDERCAGCHADAPRAYMFRIPK